MKSSDLLKLIPTKVRITNKVSYEVLFTDAFPNSEQVGECRPEHKQIVIKNDESPTETFKTFIHECLHAVSFETPGLNLTENQVSKLEETLFRSLKLNKVFDKLIE